MLDVTPQERLALTVLAVLLVGGAVGRHAAHRADTRQWLEYTTETADTLGPSSSPALRQRASEELTLQRIRSTPLQPGERIDPNTAPPEQLARLPRIGPALADRIVAHRQANGPFRTIDDLRSVAGIGPALLEGITPYVELPAAGPIPFGGGGGAVGVGAGDRIDINRASAEELQRLPGIGPAIAQRIVEHRAANGHFRSFPDLERVPGIGPRLRERLEAAARLGP